MRTGIVGKWQAGRCHRGGGFMDIGTGAEG